MGGSATIFLLVYLVNVVSPSADATRCYSCSDVADSTKCNYKEQCAIDEKCFTERYGDLPYAKFHLGCIDKENCPGQPSKAFSLIRQEEKRSVVPQCRECCQTDGCNYHACDFNKSAPTSLPSVPCKDDTKDCAHLNDTIMVCADIDNAKTVCRKYCGLCDLVDGNWNVWATWSSCSVSCDVGTVSRQRTCSNPAPANGGLTCAGKDTETKSCKLRDCPVHGGWKPWSHWETCSAACGLGLTKRRRTCTNPTPSLFGQYCFGDATEINLCNGTRCSDKPVTPEPPPTICVDLVPSCSVINDTLAICTDSNKARAICRKYCGLCGIVDGHWNGWSKWTTCSLSCGNGISSRLRTCDNPSPANGGLQCSGQSLETRVCNEHECPVHGAWVMWSAWSDCSSSCGTGLTQRKRTCDNPRPSLFGAYCFGDPTEYSLCEITTCAVNGNWGVWGGWGSCSNSCGGGLRHRRRTCSNPEPTSGGKYCDGDPKEDEFCETRTCAVNGNWGVWGGWSSCSNSCGTGLRHRRRTCSNPEPTSGGKYCDGDPKEYESCETCTAHVAFQASLTSGSSISPILFNSVSLNDGNAYSPSTGIFRAPARGQYLFSVTVLSKAGSYANVQILKNGNTRIGYFHTGDAETNKYGSGSKTVITDLNQADRVTVTSDTQIYTTQSYTSFSGVLLRQK